MPHFIDAESIENDLFSIFFKSHTGFHQVCKAIVVGITMVRVQKFERINLNDCFKRKG